MKFDLTFPKQILFALFSMSIIASYPLWKHGSGEAAIAMLIGAGLSTLNALAGYVSLAYGLDRGDDTFLKVVLGGMGIRMFLMLGSLVVLIKFAGLPVIPLTIALLVSYVLYLILEIRYIQKRFRPIIQGLSR